MGKVIYENINPDLKVGYNCYYMCLSSILEYKDLLHFALTYTYLDFIYDCGHFTTFTTDEPAENFISPTNDLVIARNIGSVIRNDHNGFIKNSCEGFNAFEVREFRRPGSLKQIKEEYLDKNIPLIISNDLYYLYDDYRKQINNFLLYHIGIHMSVLAGIDIDKNTCTLLDRFFSFVGDVTIDNFDKAMDSSYIDAERKSYMHGIEILEANEQDKTDSIRKHLADNISFTLQEETAVNGRHYYKNTKALSMLVKDYDEIAYQLIKQKGKYAPQFFINILSPFLWHRVSFSNLIKYLCGEIKLKELEELIPILDETAELWLTLDKVSDKCYLSGNNLDSYKNKIVSIFGKLIEKENRALDVLDGLQNKLI